ncbi:hypothetical protein [Streptosporangium minutum]|nr:hypothetical protein [Streptosporangium minutum]
MDDTPDFADFAAERIDALFRYAYMLTGNPHDAGWTRRRWAKV